MGASAGGGMTQAQQNDYNQRVQAAKSPGAVQSQPDIYSQMESLRPGFISAINPDRSLNDNLAIHAPVGNRTGLSDALGGIQLDQRGLNAFRDRALAAPGTSAWEQMMRQQQGTQQLGAQEQASAQGAQAAAQARTSLAMRGGLSGGSAERLARDQANNQLMANQGIARSGEQANQNIGIQAENQRLQALGQLPGMDLAALQPGFQKASMMEQQNQFNIGQQAQADQANQRAALLGIGNLNQNNSNTYGQQMQALAGNQQAKAIENSGKK